MRPGEEVIGEAAIMRLELAGYDVVRREPRDTPRWRCPHCSAIHQPAAGIWADMFLDWGEMWHRPCVTKYQVAPSKRGDRRPMIEEAE